MNDEQRIKAERILYSSSDKEAKRRLALYEHLATIEEVETYKLPYRVLIDHKRAIHQKGYAPISNIYTLPGYPKDKRPIFNYPGDYIDNEPKYKGGSISNLNMNAKRVLYEFIQEYTHDWNDESTWDYYFLHLLEPYNFNEFTVFDFFGDKRNLSPGDMELLVNYYKRKQKQYKDNKSLYLQCEPTYTSEELEKYSYTSHLVKYDDDIVNEYIQTIYKGKDTSHIDIPNVLANGTLNDVI